MTKFKSSGNVRPNRVTRGVAKCLQCGIPFMVHRYRLDTVKFCSRNCRGRSQTGTRAGGWRGGGSMHYAGYKFTYDPAHPNVQPGHGIYVYEHRKVAAEMLGRPLLPNEIVHHKNGDKRDNRPDNLSVMTQSEHVSLHHKQRTTPNG